MAETQFDTDTCMDRLMGGWMDNAILMCLQKTLRGHKKVNIKVFS